MRLSRRNLIGNSARVAAAVSMPGPIWAQALDPALTDRLQLDLQTHAGFGLKFSGSDGDNATADWVATRLQSAGYDVAVTSFDAPFFIPRNVGLRTIDQTVEVIAQAPVVPTAPEGIEARLTVINAENGNPTALGDVRGRIAVVLTPEARHAALFPNRGFGPTVIAAHEAGAAAVVIVTNGPTGEAIALNCPEEPFVPIPAAILAPQDANAILTAAEQGSPAVLTIDGEATHRPCRNVVARLDRGPEWIAISTPRSGWFQCVAERGTGTAAFLEVANWARERFPDKSVFLMNTGGHEYFFAGSHRVLHDAPPAESTRAWMHVGATLAARDAESSADGWTMLETADPGRRVMATASAADAASAAFAGLSGMSPPDPIQPLAGELSTFTGLGYTTAFAALGVHRWFHTRSDSLDCTSAELLSPVVVAHQRTLELLLA